MPLTEFIDHVARLVVEGNLNMHTIFPASWFAYIEVMRLDHPLESLMPMLIYSIGLTFAACVTQSPISIREYLGRAILSDLWLFIMCHALCAYNDAVDYEYDRKVKRCRTRPVARGAITPEQALKFSSIHILIGMGVLSYLPERSHLLGVITTLVMMAYPYGKRFTYFPQFIMGSSFIVCTFMACAVIGIDASLGSAHFPSVFGLGLVSMLMVVIADVIYAYQDMREDARAGVKSMTLVLGD